MASAETELSSLATSVEALRQRFEHQQSVTTLLAAAAAKYDAELRTLRQTLDVLSFQMREQAETVPGSAGRHPPRRAAASIGFGLGMMVLGAGVAAWIAFGREPTLGALAHQFVAPLSGLIGAYPGGGDTAGAFRTVVPATLDPDRTPPPQAAAASAAAVMAPVTVVVPSATSSVALPPPTQIPVTTTSSPPAEPVSDIPPAPPMPAPAAAPPIPESQTVAPTATPLALFSRPEPVRQLVLRATADTWIKVRTKAGRVLVRRTMKEGETWPVPAEPDLVLDTGHRGGLDLEVDGVPIRLTIPKGGVIHGLPLDPDLVGPGTVRPMH